MAEEFEWTDDVTVLTEQLEVAVYVNPKGETVIRQAARERGDDDAIVIIGRRNLPSFVRALQLHLNEQDAQDAQDKPPGR